MKVKFKPLANGYYKYKTVKYREGDILDLEEDSHFKEEFMEVVVEPVVVPIVAVETVPIEDLSKQTVDVDTGICVPCVPEEEPVELKTEILQLAKSKRVRRKVDV